jgi:hypothetical protein
VLRVQPPTDRLARLKIGLLVPCIVVAGIIGPSATASDLSPTAVLLNGTTCTVTLSGQAYSGTCSGGFVQGTPSPTPAPSLAVLYASSSFWNAPVGATPLIDPNSTGMVAAALAPAGCQCFLTDNAWGRALVYSHNSDPLSGVGCTAYDCSVAVSFHIPTGAVAESGSDGHLVVINQDTAQELDMWQASFNATTSSWSASSRYVTDAAGWGALCPQGQHCNSALSSGFVAFGGIIRPEEIQLGHIDHALYLTTPLVRNGYIACPATNTNGPSTDPNSLPMGARVQLDPAFNVDGQSWPAWEKTIAHALQTYGAYVATTGGSLALYGQGNQNGGLLWSTLGVASDPSIANLPWSSFRVLQLQQC